MKIPYITFIIPTINRISLKRAIESVLKQTLQDFRIIVVFDGVEKHCVLEDDRIMYIEAPMTKSAGLTRNFAFQFVQSKWIGFIDDDDIIYEKYIEELSNLDNDDIDFVLFRMLSTRITPKLQIKNKIFLNEAGISFAIKSAIQKNSKVVFSKTGSEDFKFMNSLCKLGYKFKISDYIAYEVCRDNRDKI